MSEEIIGNARLILGDCRNHVDRIKYESIITDPPYGMAYQSNRRKVVHEHIKGDNDMDHIRWVCSLPASHSKYVFCRWQNLFNVPMPKSYITWIKNNHGSGDLRHSHAPKTEGILFYPGNDHFFPWKRPSDVVEYAKVSTKRHPTEKPVDLMETIVSWTAGVVLDPFMGTGSTGVACMYRSVPFVGVEVVPEYHRIACERMHAVWKDLADA